MLEELMTAVVKDNTYEVKNISEKMNVNTRTKQGDTPLMSAIRNNLIEVVQILLDNGANPNFPDASSWYPIHFATQKENLKIVKLLVEYGANIDQQDKFGNTALSVAISKTEGRNFIDYFLALGTDINIPNKAGVTPIDAAKLYKISLK